MKELLKISLPQLEVDLVSPVEKLRHGIMGSPKPN